MLLVVPTVLAAVRGGVADTSTHERTAVVSIIPKLVGPHSLRDSKLSNSSFVDLVVSRISISSSSHDGKRNKEERRRKYEKQEGKHRKKKREGKKATMGGEVTRAVKVLRLLLMRREAMSTSANSNQVPKLTHKDRLSVQDTLFVFPNSWQVVFSYSISSQAKKRKLCLSRG